MKLYTFPLSQNSLRVVAVTNQAHIDLEIVPVDLAKGEHMKPEYLALNPNHKIPTLVDGDFVLWDSTAIIFYLADLKPRSKLVPKDRHDRMHMYKWVTWNLSEFSPPCGSLQFERMVKKLFNMGDPDANVVAKAEENFHRFAKVLNAQLAGRDWLVGDCITLADHHVASTLVHAEAASMPLAGYDHIRGWRARVYGTKAWKKALKALRH